MFSKSNLEAAKRQVNVFSAKIHHIESRRAVEDELLKQVALLFKELDNTLTKLDGI